MSTSWSGPGSPIPTIMAPDFVRNRLLAEVIGGWTIDVINGVEDQSPDDAG